MPKQRFRGQPPTFTFYDRPGYFKQLANEISRTKAGDRVVLMTMPLDTHIPPVAQILEELRLAALRGVRVLFTVDAYSFLLKNRWQPGPLWYHGRIEDAKLRAILKPPYDYDYACLEALKAAGGSYRIINVPERRFSLPQGGRAHIKLAVVNNTVKIGGHSLTNPTELDLMAGFDHKPLADYICNFTQRIIESEDGSVRKVLADEDQQFTIDAGADESESAGTGVFGANAPANIFIDAGVPNQSRIMEEALKMIDESREWLVFTCQYFPGGIVGKYLAQAVRRNVQVRVIYNHPSKHGVEWPGHLLYNSLQKLWLPCELFAFQLPKALPQDNGSGPKTSPRLHAKLIANEQGAILGSHNYVVQGVRLGTAEIALQVRSPEFSRQAVEFMGRMLPARFTQNLYAE